MVIIYGTRFYGKVQACGRSHVGTQFVHLYYLPLIPIGTHLILEQNADGTYKGLKTAFSFRSMMAAYLRVWGPIAVIAAICIGMSALGDVSDEPLAMAVVGVFTAVVVLAMLVGTILGWAVVGKLSTDEKRKRGVYALHMGYHVDPADLGEARRAFRDGLLSTISDRARGLAAMGYRMNADPSVAWPHVALDPTHNDEALITAAFTLARLDASLSEGPQKMQLEQVHDQLWQRISSTNAPYLHVPA
ncbi:MAG: hypothetical protein QOI41_7294 [Myxococcales bacterium]|nr:hypothetical protein [Myxococcales bacterium]